MGEGRFWKRGRFAIPFAVMAAAVPLMTVAPVSYANDDVGVAQGVGAHVLQNAAVFGSTPSDTPVTVSIVLRARDEMGLGGYITESTGTHRYLSVSQFADRYGQSDAVIHSITSYLAGFGIQTTVYSDKLNITASGTAGQFDKAFSVSLRDMQYHGVRFHGTVADPRMPMGIASPILAVLGLTNYGNFASHVVKPLSQLKSVTKASTTGDVPAGMLTPSDLANRYDVTPLYKQGATGQGQTIGIVTLASLNPSDAYQFWANTNIPVSQNRITLDNIDGGSGPVSLSAGSDETTLDVEQSGALAPNANIIVYQAPNTDYGFADAFFSAVTQNTAGSISTSWGESEDAITSAIQSGGESPEYAQVFNEVFMEAAAQGISVFAASGDAGAYDASRDAGTTDLSVDSPADSPYVTAAGGTTLGGTQSYQNSAGQIVNIPVPQERTWSWDYFFPFWSQMFGAPDEASLAQALISGSGGGYSKLFAMPAYQMFVPGIHHFSAVPWFTPTQNNTAWTFNANPSVTSGFGGNGRVTPDLAMDADPQTGYAVYSTLFGGSGSDANWSQYGGTSFVAPQLAGITAVINSAVGRRVGFWNDQIYRFARMNNSPFHPLDASGTQNDNLYYTGTPGAIYNPGSGLGTPDVATLAKDFAGGFGDGFR